MPSTSIADDFVCWSRMQSEAGQELDKIVQRKENERRAGGGLFFWGVGNAPSKAIPALARLKREVPIYFSIMKSKPKLADSAPSSVVVWRRYIDLHGMERPLPPSALITSRGNSGSGTQKTRHFALVCTWDEKLELKYGRPFDHHMYRNAGPNGGQIGASQVTALLTRDRSINGAAAQYEVNLEARLTGGYWVRLTDPIPLSDSQIALYNCANVTSSIDWIEFVSELRQRAPTRVDSSLQLGLI
ncbi:MULTISPECIES: hypothetical protein [Rhizobiaceae]|uniref:hypothetical protein n=1 Tax=Rhizobiaceae TaxID=82115 RepID=UPI001C5FA14C|nr:MULTISPECIES: hypothetical protein [Rhizobiaceae]QYA17414.1 hypothetical protein J5284_34420 [Rhizobium sp. AB2/73]UEQ85734.1 hypothetical protein I8E17_34400 [Rhizobium sp. AB2/73]